MADERIIVRLDFQGLDEATQDIGELEREIRKLRAEQKKLEKDTDNLAGATKEQTQQYAQLDVKIKELRKDKSDLTRNVNKLNQAEKANLNTINGLTKRNAALTAEMRKLDMSTEQGRQRMTQLRAEFLQNDQRVRQFNESLNRHQHNVGNYSGSIKGAINGLQAMAAGITAAVFAFQRINAMMSESINLFKAQEKAERQLAFAVGDANEELIQQAQALQRQTTFGDEAVIQMQALLGSFGSTAEQIKALTPLILDYAAASGQDLSSAATKVNNILNGTSTTLRGTAIRLSETADANTRYNAVLQEFNKFQGAAAALADTQAGKLEQLENLYGDQQEILGSKLIPVAIKMQEVLLALIDGFTTLGGNVASLVNDFARLFDNVNLFNSAYAQTAEITDEVTVSTHEATKAAQAEAIQIEELFSVLTDENAAKEQKDLATKQLNASYAPYLQNIDLEKAGIEELNVLQEQLINTMTKRILLQRQEEQIAPLLEERATLVQAIALAEQHRQDELTKLADAAGKDLVKIADANAGLSHEIDYIVTSTGRIFDANANLEEELAKVDQRIQDITFSYDNLLSGIGETIEATNDLTTANDNLDKSQQKVNRGLTAEFGELTIEKTNEVKAAFDSLISTFAEIPNAEADLYDAGVSPAFERMQERAAKANAVLQQVNQAYALVGQAMDVRFQNQSLAIERQATEEKEAVEQSIANENQKRIEIERIEQKAALDKEKLEQKQAKARKADAIIQSLINGALAVTNHLATAPFPINFASLGAIIGISAAQTAIIAAQQFAEGGQVADLGGGDGGLIGGHLANMPAMANGDNVLATVKTGEVILNKGQQQRLKALAGSNVFGAIGVPNFADGGVVPEFTSGSMASAQRIETASAEVAATVRDLRVVNVATETSAMALRVQNIENEATIG